MLCKHNISAFKFIVVAINLYFNKYGLKKLYFYLINKIKIKNSVVTLSLNVILFFYQIKNIQVNTNLLHNVDNMTFKFNRIAKC